MKKKGVKERQEKQREEGRGEKGERKMYMKNILFPICD